MSKYSALGIVFLTSISCLNAMEGIDAKNTKRDALQELDVAFSLDNKDSINDAITITYNLGQHTENISAACFSPNRSYCSFVSNDGSTYIYNVDDSKLIVRMEAKEPVTALCWSHDSRYLIGGFKKGLLSVYDVKDGKPEVCFSCLKDIEVIDEIPEELQEISSLCMSPDNKFLVLGFASGTIMVLNTQEAFRHEKWGEVGFQGAIQGHKCRVASLCFNVDDNGKEWLASCAGKKIKIWDFKEIEKKEQYMSYIKFTDTADVLSICFNPYGKSIASGHADNTIKIWDIDENRDNKKPLYTLSGHSDVVSSVRYNSNGRLLLSGSYDNTVKFWDMTLPEPKELKTSDMKDKICHLSLSEDYMYILTGLEDGTISITTFARNDMMDKVSSILHAKKEENIRTGITEILTSLSIITQSLVVAAMKKSDTLRHWLPEIHSFKRQ